MQYDWIDFYIEFATKLLPFKNDRKSLIRKIYAVYNIAGISVPKLESGDEIIDIDPFTIFGTFNKEITNANRIAILNGIASEFGIAANVPGNFDGIPVLNNLKATFYGFKDGRKANDIDNLWSLFEVALALADNDTEDNRQKFSEAYDKVHDQLCIRWNITMGLYWIRPYTFINLDSRNRWFISDAQNMPGEFVVAAEKKLKKVPYAADYLEIKDLCKKALDAGEYGYKNFPDLSYMAWVVSEKVNQEIAAEKDKKTSKAEFLKWFMPLLQALRDLGGSATPADARKKIIENEHLSDEIVNETRGKTNVNKFENEVAFARNYLVEAGYIDKSVRGVWTLTEAGKTVELTAEMASDIFKKIVSGAKSMKTNDSDDEQEIAYQEYTVENFLDDVYMSEDNYTRLVGLLRNKKNIILQGAPGVGKTYVAKCLAYSMMGVEDVERVMMVQFHQSYSYEDFIMGFRPSATGFELRKGAFYNFCKKAEVDSDNEYFFIIDEINRGNLSKIFGELFMLIENDKRGKALQLLYSDEKFAVPKNVYIIGMMNTADRSLAMLDYALRRRFAFFDIKPGFETTGFSKYRMALDNEKFDKLINCVESLNREISDDESLGEGFCIGHSYFCNLQPDTIDDSWLYGIVEYELIPLLKEYWFDEPMKVKDWSKNLRSAIK